jgi:hypothetical protein
MTSVSSTPLARRKKQTVYGKSSGKPYSPAGTGFFEDDETAWVSIPQASRKYKTTIPARPVKPVVPQTEAEPTVEPTAQPKPQLKPQSKPQAKRPGALPTAKKSPVRVKDTWDVPSDDESTEVFGQTRLPPKQRIQSRLLDEPKEEVEQLAPWEKKSAKQSKLPSSTASGSSRSKAAAKEENVGPISLRRGESGTGKAMVDEKKEAHTGNTAPETANMTAMQRLAARRRQAQMSDTSNDNKPEAVVKEPPKRTAVKANAYESPQNKRRRITPQPSSPLANLLESEATPVAKIDNAVSRTATLKDSGDIYDVPSDDEVIQPVKSTLRKTARLRQRTPVTGMLRKLTPQKGLSAPSRLEDMVESEDELALPSTETRTPERPGTPKTALRNGAKETPSTPSSDRSSNAKVQRPGTLTPKQTQLWAELLEPAGVPFTGMKKLSITEDMVKKKPTRAAPAILQRSSSDVPVRRTRIVDRLKASAPNSSDEESEDDDDEPGTSMPSVKPVLTDATASPETNSLSQVDRSQDRPTKPTASGSLITYSQQRSHLADDDLESALMLDIPMYAPERPAATSRRVCRPDVATRTTSYKDDELEDAPAGGLRTIHELRAGGRNARIMGEIEDLLGEIADHATSVRSRRRGALLDLTTKLMDKTFAEQIISHEFDHALLKECKTPTDPSADFLVATSLLLLLHSEPPRHTLDSFGEALPCISRWLAESTDISKVVKERRSNMSRSAQGDVVGLSDKLKGTQSLWGETKPTVMSSRLVALKIVDLVVRKLREAGDQSDLLENDALTLLVPKAGFSGLQSDAGKAFEASLVISILEALKTLSAAGNWPDTCISLVASLPATFAEHWQAPASTKWLAYRLCANITNDSPTVRSAFIENAAVRHLTAEVVTGLETLHNPPVTTTTETSDTTSARAFDILVLSIGTLINLTEHCPAAQHAAVHSTTLPALTLIVRAFLEGQKRALEAESVEQSAANVAYGYLAIMLANVCQDEGARRVMRGLFPGGRLDVLVNAVEEFVVHHQRVDGLEGGDGGGAEGKEWSSFTERLVGVFVKLKAGEGEMMEMEGVQ